MAKQAFLQTLRVPAWKNMSKVKNDSAKTSSNIRGLKYTSISEKCPFGILTGKTHS